MERRPVFKAINRPMTFAGVDRRLFFGALMLGAAIFNLFATFLGGIVAAMLAYIAARLAQRQDPKFLDIVMAARRQRSAYDAAKRVEGVQGPW